MPGAGPADGGKTTTRRRRSGGRNRGIAGQRISGIAERSRWPRCVSHGRSGGRGSGWGEGQPDKIGWCRERERARATLIMRRAAPCRGLSFLWKPKSEKGTRISRWALGGRERISTCTHTHTGTDNLPPSTDRSHRFTSQNHVHRASVAPHATNGRVYQCIWRMFPI